MELVLALELLAVSLVHRQFVLASLKDLNLISNLVIMMMVTMTITMMMMMMMLMMMMMMVTKNQGHKTHLHN